MPLDGIELTLATTVMLADEPIFLVVGAAMLGVVAIAVNLRTYLQTRQVERTRREVAAYIAEGSMPVDDGIRLLETLGDRRGAAAAGSASACCGPRKGKDEGGLGFGADGVS